MDETLEKLEEINQDLTNIEEKLNAIPDTQQLDLTKYNRKQRRQIQRKMIRNEKSKQRKIEQKENIPVTRKEFVGLFQSMQKLRDRLYYVDVLSAVIENILINKNIITREELKVAFEEEGKRAQEFQNIQQGVKDYENRLKKCVELEIDPNISVIGKQLYEDAEVSIDEKLRLAEAYNLKLLLSSLKT